MSTLGAAGIATQMKNFEKFVLQVKSFDGIYNPSNPLLVVSKLEQLYQESLLAIESVVQLEQDYNSAITKRKNLYDALNGKVTRIYDFLKSAGIPSGQVEDVRLKVKRIKNQIRRREEVPAPTLADAPATEEKKRNTIHNLMETRLHAFAELIEYLKDYPNYKPNESDLELTAIIDYYQSLVAVNTELSQKAISLGNARTIKNKTLFNPETGMLAVVKMVKSYSRSAFGANSPEFAKVNAIKFRSGGYNA